MPWSSRRVYPIAAGPVVYSWCYAMHDRAARAGGSGDGMEVDLAITETAAVVLRLSAFVHQEDDLWVAGCPSLDVFSQGNSAEDAKANLQEAVELWIDSCLERNKLGEALRELGWYRISPGSLHPSHEVMEIVGQPESLGDEYPLEVEIPAYQAALFSGGPAHAPHG